MKNITLEDLLQKHFCLNGDLISKSADVGHRKWTLDGLKSYGKMVDFLYDLGNHVKIHVNDKLGNDIIKLVDTFDEYEHTDF